MKSEIYLNKKIGKMTKKLTDKQKFRYPDSGRQNSLK